jgi:hypothetical protein
MYLDQLRAHVHTCCRVQCYQTVGLAEQLQLARDLENGNLHGQTVSVTVIVKCKWFQSTFLEKEKFRFTVMGDGCTINIILKCAWSHSPLLAKEKFRFIVTGDGFLINIILKCKWYSCTPLAKKKFRFTMKGDFLTSIILKRNWF